MSDVVSVRIHPSQFPENVRSDLLRSLRTRQINHKFHYDSIKQTQKWLALHQVYSPSRTDADCAATYNASFVEAAAQTRADKLHLIGLGCGGGQKDARLLQLLKEQGRELLYTPCDVSVAMVLVAQQVASKIVGPKRCLPFVCDLASEEKMGGLFSSNGSQSRKRLLTFFGMIPNFEPQVILPKLAGFLRKGDFLLFSANLAPGKNYANGVKTILPLYDNDLTRDWLLTFLTDLGVTHRDGELHFGIEERRVANTQLKRILATFNFSRPCVIELPEESFEFRAGDSIRLFFSYRYTPEKIRDLLARHRLIVLNQWITKSGEEGVFLCRK